MTAKKAAEILKSKYNNKSIVECLEFADFFAFALTDKGKEKELRGGGYNTVNKKTGIISTFNPIQNMSAYMAAKLIDINTLN